jgi:amino acid permease
MTTDVKGNQQQQHERSPLLVSTVSIEAASAYADDNGGDDAVPFSFVSRQGSATVSETMTNMTKTCMGTGCLALPYAAQEGGALLYVFGLFGIALWNVYASKRLCDCWELLFFMKDGDTKDSTTRGHTSIQNGNGNENVVSTGDAAGAGDIPTSTTSASTSSRPLTPPPPQGTAALGTIAWYALGPMGLVVLDALTVLLLMGIIVAYNDAIRSFLQGTPFTTDNDVLDAIFIAFLIAPLSVVPDMGYLTKTSAAGLGVLGAALFIVAAYGVYNNHDDTHETTTTMAETSLQWFPRQGLAGVSHWFGCTVFGFGIVPLTLNFRESMAEPARLPYATLFALLLVAALYIVIGIGLLALYPNIESDVLSQLPREGWLPVVTRLAMVVVVVATAPLLIVPCAEIIEGKLLLHGTPAAGPGPGEQQQHPPISERSKVVVRFGICFVTVAISVGIPEFVGVLTFVGCFCVAFVSFCIPPTLHLVLLKDRGAPWRSMWVDAVMLVWGLTATGISTSYVFQRSIVPSASLSGV